MKNSNGNDFLRTHSIFMEHLNGSIKLFLHINNVYVKTNLASQMENPRKAKVAFRKANLSPASDVISVLMQSGCSPLISASFSTFRGAV